MWPLASIHKPGALPRGFGITVAPSGNHRLAAIDFGHHAAEAAEKFLDVAEHAFIQF